MHLLLPVCLTWILLHTAESLRCHECSNALCTNSTSVECPITSMRCKTITSATMIGLYFNFTVGKSCSSLLTCVSPLNTPTEWSVNRGFMRQAHNQLCCDSDDCNLLTLAVPNPLENGLHCPSCASANHSADGTCNSSVACLGVEDRCFNGTTTSDTRDTLHLGCMSRNLCSEPLVHQVLFGADPHITCGTCWSCSLSAALLLLLLALTAQEVLV